VGSCGYAGYKVIYAPQLTPAKEQNQQHWGINSRTDKALKMGC